MKILFAVGEFPSLSETFILNQITGLSKIGLDLRIIAEVKGTHVIHRDIEKYNLLEKTSYISLHKNYFVRFFYYFCLIIFNIYKTPLKILRSLNIFKYGKDSLSLRLLSLTIFFSENNFDIVYCHFGNIGNVFVKLKEIGFNFKLITMFHGQDIRDGIINNKDYYKRLFKHGDCFLAISNYNRKYLKQFGANSLKIIFHPVGIDINKFSFKKKKDLKKNKLSIITVSRLVKEKDLRNGIEVVSRLIKIYPHLEIQYKIIGSGPLKTELKKEMNKLRLNNHVKFLGALNQDEVIRELQYSDIFLLPSAAEALPVSLMEAQAVGLPVIATKVGAVEEIVMEGKSGFLAKPGSSKTLIAAFKKLIENKNSWNKMGAEGRKIIYKKYNIEKLNRQLIKIFKTILKENPSREVYESKTNN